jgi:sulfoxide reductase heme-binding subunit YedZ
MNDWLPWLDRKGRFSALRAAAFALVLAPALWLAAQALIGQLGAKPWTQAVHDTGTWALRLLLVTLAVTPLRRLYDWPKLVTVRRMLGLAVMFYALGHLGLYSIDLALDWRLILSEIVKRFYLLVGITALIGLVVLGVTSTDSMIRRLGAPRWQRLHRLVYPIMLLGLFHFALQSKIDVTEPALLTGFFLLLMLWRGLERFRLGYGPAALVGAALLAGLGTALIEAAWYALATGAPAALVLAANLDLLTDPDPIFVRPAHWVALTGLAAAALRLVLIRAGRLQPKRRKGVPQPARA